MTTKFKKLTEVEPGEKSELSPSDNYVHPELKHHMPTPEKIAKAKLLQAKMERLQKQLEKLRKAQEKAARDKNNAEYEKANLIDIDPKIVQVASLIKRDCSYALSSMKETNCWLYRGIRGYPPDIFTGKPRENRIAKDSSSDIQEKFDELLKEAGFNALRSNSIFCSGNYGQASNYGSVYMIFPKNGFNFTWSPKFRDLYSDLLSTVQHNGITSLYHTKAFSENKQALIGQLVYTRSIVDEAQYILRTNSYFNNSFETFLSTFDLENKQHLHSMTQRVFKNRDVILSTVKKLDTQIYNAITILKESSTLEDNQKFDIQLTQIIQVLRRLDGIKLLPIFYEKIKYYLMNNSTTFVDNQLLTVIKNYNEVRDENPLNPKQIIIDSLEFNNDNFTEALQSKNEICVAGEYYAVRYDDNADHFYKLFGIGSRY